MSKPRQWKSKAELNGAAAIPTNDTPVPEITQASVGAADAPALFCTLSLNPKETLATYQALRFYSRGITSQESDALDMLEIVVGVMKELRPAAIKAAALFQPPPQPQQSAG
jgi:hypothetical protein